MTNAAGRSAVAPLIFATLTARMLGGLSLDLPDALNAVWMCPLAGLILFLPFGFAVRLLERMGNDSPLENLRRRAPSAALTGCMLLFALLLLWDAASMLRLTAISCNVVSLSNVSLPLLILPLAVAVLIVARMGVEAIGNSARIWTLFLPIPMLFVALIQLGSYNPRWLSPVLGPGPAEILSGGVYCAGCMALLSLPWMIAVPDRCSRSLTRYVALAAVASSIILLLLQMLCPAQIDGGLTRIARVELLLSNGRMRLSPQMVTNLLWFGSMLYLTGAESASAVSFLRRALPGPPRWLWVALAAACALVLPIFNPAWLRAYPSRAGLMFVISGSALALLMLLSLPAKGGARNARA